MHKPSLAQLVYNATFPRPRTSDPASFSAHITRNLVPEVRVETSTFYGSLDCIEAQYPGLDYSYGPHRMRLGRFPWHRKLFRVFDELALTEAEISSLCRWEGTKSARERYEKEEDCTVRDTTADNIRVATPPPVPSIEIHSEDVTPLHSTQEQTTEVSQESVTPDQRRLTPYRSEGDEEEETSDEEMESYGVELNHRLLAATAARERGANVPLDEDWEQWLKEAVERGGYPDMINSIRGRSDTSPFVGSGRTAAAVSVSSRAALFPASDETSSVATAPVPVAEPHTLSTQTTIPPRSRSVRHSNRPSGTAR
ncbi:conserved hypothetical protein [Paecilomyces variotii No. 5]|uniref:Uncharacterized protein n=1 Tax=Byssochlamys spectabilis (strain No. 5 / NBRC 109023) TaxID=1356009 RepID=V5HTF9_BYSSN|nr:conserved hypothetical protein [Paecilomyces variotii No. 5]